MKVSGVKCWEVPDSITNKVLSYTDIHLSLPSLPWNNYKGLKPLPFFSVLWAFHRRSHVCIRSFISPQPSFWGRIVRHAARSCTTLGDPVDCSPPGSSVHGTLQARILEWVAMPSSRGSSWPRDRTHVSYVFRTGRRVLYHCTTWEVPQTCQYQVNWCWIGSYESNNLWERE